jgi:hypothetical protein
MKAVLATVVLLSATGAMAAPVDNAKSAVKVACTAIHTHMPGDGAGNCDDFIAILRGNVWTVSQKWVAQNQIGGGAPVVEVSQDTGEVLNFYLSD